MAKESDKDKPLPEYGEVRDEEQLDWPKLVAYLRENKVAGSDQPLKVLQFRGGHSNLTYLLRFGDHHEWAVRRPPVGPLPPSAHDMAREHRVLSRGWEKFQPAPRALRPCEDPTIIRAPRFGMHSGKG